MLQTRFTKTTATRQVVLYASRFISAQREPVTEINASNESLTDVIQPYFDAKRPVLVRQAMINAPAIQKWTDWKYLESVVDMEAICHVEIGGNYAQSNRAELHLGDYLAYLQFFEEKYGRSGGEPSPEDLVYLAQNDIVQGLDQDFELPSFVSELGEGNLYSVMMWIGPHGCVSPLHFDPLDNAFMQFVGVKKALLYPPGTHVYAGEGGNQGNTSPINFDEPLDLDEYPQLVDLPRALECTITPGDLLYIPRKWWHQVLTLENSLSINAWWR